MDEQELEDWFGEQRELLETSFYTKAETTKNREILLAEFNKKYRALLAEYQTKQGSIYDRQQRNAALRKPINRWKERYIAARQQAREWRMAAMNGIKTWWFHQKIKRILRQR